MIGRNQINSTTSLFNQCETVIELFALAGAKNPTNILFFVPFDFQILDNLLDSLHIVTNIKINGLIFGPLRNIFVI